MSRCYLDTNFLYAHLRSPRATAEPDAVERWRARVLAEVTVDGGVISALVLDELAYRLVLGWLRDDGERDPLSAFRADSRAVMQAMRHRLATTWESVDSLPLELAPTDQTVVERARSLMAIPGLAPRDAFHAAHALAAGCGAIATADAAFDDLEELRRISP